MKTTLEIEDDLFRRARAAAALRGESLEDFVSEALQSHLERQRSGASAPRGWRSVFGQASREEVEAVDAVVAADLEHVDPG